jgi:hypothetical protein
MKLGAENRKKAGGAILLFAFAIFLLIRTLTTSSPAPPAPSAAAATGAPKPAAQPRRRSDQHHYVAYALAPTLDPRLRLDLMKESERLQYEGSGRNIFQDRPLDPIPTPTAPGLTGKASTPQKPKWVPAPPPQPPAIDLKFFGWANQPGEPKAVFLSRGADVFVAHEGDIVARRYKVVRITPNSVEIEDVLSNNRQSIPLTQG